MPILLILIKELGSSGMSVGSPIILGCGCGHKDKLPGFPKLN